MPPQKRQLPSSSSKPRDDITATTSNAAAGVGVEGRELPPLLIGLDIRFSVRFVGFSKKFGSLKMEPIGS
jgi:hypothetical protein